MPSTIKPIPLTIDRMEVSLNGLRVVAITPEQQNDFTAAFDWDNPTVNAVAALAACIEVASYNIIGNPWDIADGKKRILFGHPNNPQDDAHGIVVDTGNDGTIQVVAPETARIIVCNNQAALGLLYGESGNAESYELAGQGTTLRLAILEDQAKFIAHARLHALREPHDCRSH